MNFSLRTRPWLALGTGIALVGALGQAPVAAAAAPSNDTIAQAVVVTGPGFTATADTSEATYVSTEPACGVATVWYSYTPSVDGRVLIDTVGSDYDTMLGVFTGSPTNLTWVTCHDDDVVNSNEQIVLDVSAGTTYYIQAGTCCEGTDGQVGPGGALAFHVSEAPPAMQVGVAIQRRGVVTRFGEARLRGSLVCRPEARWAEISVQIRQRQGRRIVTAGAYATVACTSARRAWTLKLANEVRSFQHKAALVRVSATACDAFTCDDATRQRPVRLR
jgi:hypothetical protein